MPPEFEKALQKIEDNYKKKINFHAWVASVISLMSVLILAFVIYGKTISALDANVFDHNRYDLKDKIIEVKIDGVIKNQNMIYYNLLLMAKRQGMTLTTKEELFINNESAKQ